MLSTLEYFPSFLVSQTVVYLAIKRPIKMEHNKTLCIIDQCSKVCVLALTMSFYQVILDLLLLAAPMIIIVLLNQLLK